MKVQIILFLLFQFSVEIFFSQKQNKVSLQLLGSSYSYWTLNYERNVFSFENSNILVGSGINIRKSSSNSYSARNDGYIYKEAPTFFNNSLYLKYVMLRKNKIRPHTTLGYVYSILINKDKVGDTWQGKEDRKNFTKDFPAFYTNIGSSFYFKENIGINADFFLFKLTRNFNRLSYNYLISFGLGIVCDF
jgi:hypothetical protein